MRVSDLHALLTPVDMDKIVRDQVYWPLPRSKLDKIRAYAWIYESFVHPLEEKTWIVGLAFTEEGERTTNEIKEVSEVVDNKD